MKLRNILISICFLTAALPAAGQEFRFQTDTDPYLFLYNPAALSVFNGHISMAEASFRKDDGGLISLTESPDSYKAGALTESYISVSDKLSFHGKLSWSYFDGKRMGGQVLMDPEFNPVNFLESDPTTVGGRNREDYSLLGAMSYKLGERWSLGAGIEYSAADQTKIKDPRFSSVWMDMGLKAGVSFRPSDSTLLGLALVYRSTLEQLKGGIFGTTDQQYFILTDKGYFFGTMDELAGDYNKISVNNIRPMKNDFYGLSLSAVSGGFSNELEVLYRSGYYGKKSSGTATFYEYSGVNADYRGQLLAHSGQDIHRATLDLGYRLLANDENLFEYVTRAGENTEVQYFGSNRVTFSHRFVAGIGYEWMKDVGGFLPSFVAGASLKGSGRLNSTVLYPFSHEDDVYKLAANAFARKNLEKGKSVFSIELGAGYSTGLASADYKSYSTPIATSIQNFDVYMNRQLEYDTASAASVNIGFGYTIRITDKFAPCVKVTDSLSALLADPQYLSGRTRNVALLTVGCTF